jgi:fatty acid synthase
MALVVRGKIEEGQSILIHAGAGGVGQAAIHVALSFNCKIFTTVGSNDKRAFLAKAFPQVRMNFIHKLLYIATQQSNSLSFC